MMYFLQPRVEYGSSCKTVFFLFIILLTGQISLLAQGRLVTSNTKLLEAATGTELVLTGVNTGNWLVQEGYLMEVPGVQSQSDIKRKMYKSGMTDSEVEDFYKAFRANFITKKDIDYVASLGFNCIRLPMHYELFLTPAQRAERNKVIKDQSYYSTYVSSLTTAYQNNQLFNDTTVAGYSTLDSMISWCKANNLYLIPDLHAAPGGQGNEKSIADALVPSDLWKQSVYQDITVKLWERLSSRYRNNNTIAMYDILNEPNGLPDNTQKPLLKEL